MELGKNQIKKANKAELTEWLSQLGLSPDSNDAKDVLVQKLLDYMGFNEPVETEAPEDVSETREDSRITARKKSRFNVPELAPAPEGTDMEDRLKPVTIRIASSENDKQPVRVSINGKKWLIQRDMDAVVPKLILDQLNQAVDGQLEPSTGQIRDVPRYPVQVIRS